MLRKFMVIAASTALFTVGGAFSTTADASPVEKNLSYKVYYSINGEKGTFTNEEASNFVEKALQRLQAKFQNVDIEQLKQSIPAKEKVAEKEEPKEETNAPVEEQEQPVEKKEEVQKPAEKQVEETPQAPVEQPQAQQPAESVEEPQAQQEQKEEQVQTELSEFEVQVVEKTNEERAKHGLAALQIDENLSKVARDKSKDMAVNGYFDHNSPVYGSPFDMMSSYGIDYRTAGENIAKGQRSPQEVVDAWMNSPGHRANILNGDFTHIGVGFVEQGNHWTQMFIGK